MQATSSGGSGGHADGSDGWRWWPKRLIQWTAGNLSSSSRSAPAAPAAAVTTLAAAADSEDDDESGWQLTQLKLIYTNATSASQVTHSKAANTAN
jgi:hypothetical protein